MWPQTHKELPISVSWVLGLKAVPSCLALFMFKFLRFIFKIVILWQFYICMQCSLTTLSSGPLVSLPSQPPPPYKSISHIHVCSFGLWLTEFIQEHLCDCECYYCGLNEKCPPQRVRHLNTWSLVTDALWESLAWLCWRKYTTGGGSENI